MNDQPDNAELESAPFVLTSVSDGIGRITLNDPSRLNPVDLERIVQINQAAAEMSERDDVAVVIVSGAGRGFCSGADLTKPVLGPGELLPPASGALWGPGAGTWTLVAMRQPVIAMVNGAAVGFGFELALQADIRIASSNAKFGLPFAKMGTVSDTGAATWLLPRLIGHASAAEILYTGRIFTANELLTRGLLLDVVAPEELATRTDALAHDIASGSAPALRELKRMLFDGLEQTRAHHVLDQYRRFNANLVDFQTNDYVNRFRSDGRTG